jgi:hypothetical protein
MTPKKRSKRVSRPSSSQAQQVDPCFESIEEEEERYLGESETFLSIRYIKHTFVDYMGKHFFLV